MINGKRFEEESCFKINFGFFEFIYNVGDVKGVFVGYDYLNNYCLVFKEVKLGYGGYVGYRIYGEDYILCGVRIFFINELDFINFKMWVR